MLWRAGRGFVVHDLPWTVEKLRVIPPFEFENWAGTAPGGIPNTVQVGDMGRRITGSMVAKVLSSGERI